MLCQATEAAQIAERRRKEKKYLFTDNFMPVTFIAL